VGRAGRFVEKVAESYSGKREGVGSWKDLKRGVRCMEGELV